MGDLLLQSRAKYTRSGTAAADKIVQPCAHKSIPKAVRLLPQGFRERIRAKALEPKLT
eukprot:CAMPEP_0204389964 /NCGR_PEP_ID=MMETSP0469-20131031/60409_1 /ASSEMBLY_ACC=CAM_ASM_000384 /TAXON_ID=2969 /ORGANISM="Oxyrrhis marina" /LENGTH=57 /DNA_ID=CAMNT_0051383719 /DNA_START=347 /DNA_END=516 /DNA_ORIENTATION=+